MNKLPELPTQSFDLERDRTASGDRISTAVVELPDQTELRLRLADHFALVNELPNVDRRVTAVARATAPELRSVDEPCVEEPDVWRSQWSADCYGVVESVGVVPLHTDARFDVLDVGNGAVYLAPSVRKHLPPDSRPIQPGDELYVPVTVLEVWELTP